MKETTHTIKCDGCGKQLKEGDVIWSAEINGHKIDCNMVRSYYHNTRFQRHKDWCSLDCFIEKLKEAKDKGTL